MNNIIKDWNTFILEQQNTSTNKFAIFDWDDNILFMSTPLHFQHFENGRWVNKDITIQEFSKIRIEYPDNYIDNSEWKADKNAFIEFRDFGTRGNNAFVDDIKKSIRDKKFGTSWDNFIDTLKNGELFAIVTMRGHEPDSIRNGVKYIIENILEQHQIEQMINNIKQYDNIFKTQSSEPIEKYLDCCYFIGLMSQEFKNEFSYSPVGEKLNQGKQDAINKFTNYILEIIPNSTKELFISNEKSIDFPENHHVSDKIKETISGGVKVKI